MSGLFFDQTSPILQKGNLAVSSSGEDVFLHIGNSPIPIHYEHALDLSRWMRIEGGRIKFNNGLAKTTRTLGILHDDTPKRRQRVARAAGPSIHIKRAKYEWSPNDVWGEGKLVCVKIAHQILRLPFDSALQIAQWLRVRAKQCRNIAGDTRHWSEIGHFYK